ncbi:hypothetical protein [Brevundimonas sp. GCM10030266]|uniref:hypothetical protein n=1 Tax=Brevundimonas sp. GCM10030266 TaxID=3273386 RepID=UPI0036097643
MSDRSVQYLIVGDYHGTSEIPVFFADLICAALEEGRSVNAVLEWPATATSAIETYLASAGAQQDRLALVSALGASTDGRMSIAMLDLADGLRGLRAEGRTIRVSAIQPSEVEAGGQEVAMAALLQAASQAHPDDLNLVLVGNVHAMKAPNPRMPDLRPMAAFLPAANTITINTVGYFGEAWNCRGTPGSEAPVCQAWPLRPGEPGPRRIELTPGDSLFDGRYSVGRPFTASRPEVGENPADR